MNAPVQFLSLPFWAVASIAGIACFITFLLYLLRQTPRVQWVSNVEFWIKALERSKPKFLLHNHIPFLSLLISLLAVLLFAMLMGDPRLHGSWDAFRGRTVLVVTSGSSLAAMDQGKTRLERTKEELVRMGHLSAQSGPVAVVEAGLAPRVWIPWTEHGTEIEAKLNTWKPDDGVPDVIAGLRFAESLLDQHSAAPGSASSQHRIILIGDQATDDLVTEQNNTSIPLMILPIGSPIQDVAITHFTARRDPSALGEYLTRTLVESFADQPLQMKLTIKDGSHLIFQDKFQLKPKEKKEIFASAFSSKTAQLTATLECKGDAYMKNNTAAAHVPAFVKTRVHVWGALSDPALNTALELDPSIEITRGNPIPKQTDVLVIAPGTPFDAAKQKAGLLWIKPSQQGPTQTLRITSTLQAHPAIKDLTLDGTSATNATPLQHTESTVLARSNGHALIVAKDNSDKPNGNKSITVGFVFSDSNLSEKEIFPLLVHYWIEWLKPKDTTQPLPLPLGSLLNEKSTPVLDPSTQVRNKEHGVWINEEGTWHRGQEALVFRDLHPRSQLPLGSLGGHFIKPQSRPSLVLMLTTLLIALLFWEWHRFSKGEP